MGKKKKPKPQRKWRQQQRHKEKESRREEDESRHQEEGLPSDVVYEILVRCPVKTLTKFRSVCKQWGSIFSQPSFQEDHHCRKTQASPFICLTRCEFNEASETKTNTLHISTYTSEGTLVNRFSKTDLHQCDYIPIQSCRGLVCLGPMFRPDPILICNPSTEELRALPPTQGKHICIGFGYAASTKDFKVVRFFRHPEFSYSEMCCQVFTLGTSGWREAQNSPPQYPPGFFEWGAPFLHGALHMLAVSSSDYCDRYLSVDVFNVETEFFHTLKSTSLQATYLRELEGSLCLTFDFVTVLEFWSLRDYHNKDWVKKYSVRLDSLCGIFWVDPLKIMADGHLMLNILVEDEEDGREEALYYYNFSDKSLTKDNTKMNTSGTLYVESLMRLGSW